MEINCWSSRKISQINRVFDDHHVIFVGRSWCKPLGILVDSDLGSNPRYIHHILRFQVRCQSKVPADMTWTNHVVGYQIFSWTWLKCLYGLFCRFQCVPLQCLTCTWFTHPWAIYRLIYRLFEATFSSPLIYKSALQHPYLPILPIIPKPCPTFSKHL